MTGLLIGRIRGIDIRLNWSVAVVALLITWSLAESLFPDLVEGRTTTTYWVTGAITSALFLASLAAHEVSHALMANREGVQVRAITLWLFGGVAELETKPDTPSATLKIAAAGPAMSGLIGVAGVVLGLLLTGLPRAAVMWLGVMNLILMAFNLLPAFPLDGGRIYQAWLWNRDGDELAATNRAVEVGLGTGAVFVGLGVVQIMVGGLVGGVWMMAIGWFVREAARAEWRGAVTAQPLSVLTVAEVMSPAPVTVAGSMSVEAFIAGLLRSGRHAAYPVTDAAGEVIGLITINGVRRASPATVHLATVADLATPLDRVATTSPDTAVGDLLRGLASTPEARALVFDEDVLVGLVSPSDLNRVLSVVELAATHRA